MSVLDAALMLVCMRLSCERRPIAYLDMAQSPQRHR